MRDIELYRALLGLTAPWTVTGVDVDMTGQRVVVRVDAGPGPYPWSFTDVDVVVRATIAVSRHPRAVGEVFNVGTGTEITINQLATRVKALTGSRSEIVHIPYEQAYESGFEDPRRRVPDVSKIRAVVEFVAAVDTTTSLEKVIRFYCR